MIKYITITFAAITAVFSFAALPTNNVNAVKEEVTICHRTKSTENPYVVLKVDADSVDGNTGNDNGQGDHYKEHTGPVHNSSMPNGGDWGDIIPPAAGHNGLNWTTEGQAIYNNGCNPVTPQQPGTPGSAVSLVCPVNTYTLTVSNTGTTDLAVQVNGVDSTIKIGGPSITANFNVGDVLTVKVDGAPVTVQGKVLNNFTLQTCQGMGTTTTTSSTNPPVTTSNTTTPKPTPTTVVASSGFGAGAATGVSSLPVTSGNSAQIAAVIVSFSSIVAAAGAYLLRARTGMVL